MTSVHTAQSGAVVCSCGVGGQALVSCPVALNQDMAWQCEAALAGPGMQSTH